MREVADESLVDGRYRLLGRVGSGGMGDVYAAEDLHLHRRVALKFLHARFADDPNFVERFRREASSAASLAHPNIVAVFDRGEWHGAYFIAMEFVDGSTLKQVIGDEGKLSAERAIHYARQILEAVRFAHAKGVVHRDLKPQNVLIGPGDRVKVTDFGIARVAGDGLTETGSVMGTAQYVSPEQAQGHAVTGASDLYSVGVVLFEMLTGRIPFEGDTAIAIALKHVSEEPPQVREFAPEVSERLEDVVLRAMAKDSEDRFGDPDEFLAALDWATENGTGETPGIGTAAFDVVPHQEPPKPAVREPTAHELPTVYRPAPVERVERLPVEPEQVEPAVYPPYPVSGYGDAPPRKRGRRWWIVAGVALLIVAGAAAAYFLTRGSTLPMPNVVGDRVEDARSELRDLGLHVDVDRAADARPADTVIRQLPAPGREVDGGETVKLIVSSGPETTRIPDVTGLRERVARHALERAHLRVSVATAQSSEVSKGLVIRSDPPFGETVARQTRVTILVSLGPSKVKLPEVTGLGRDSAVEQLKKLGLTVVVETADLPGTKNEVISQSPSAGTKVEVGSTVTLKVSSGEGVRRVPDVVGLTLDSAAATLRSDGFTVTVRERQTSDEAEDSLVLGQSPPPSTEVASGGSVTLTVGRFVPSTSETEPGESGGTSGGGGEPEGSIDDGGEG